MQGIFTDRLKTGEKMAKYRTRIEGYKNRINAEKATLTKEELAIHSAALQKLSSYREKISVKAEEMFKTLEELIFRQTAFDKQLLAYKEAQKKFARYSKGVFGFATSVGLGVGSAGAGALEHGLTAMNECLRQAEELLADAVLNR